jgi:hypothetical protein
MNRYLPTFAYRDPNNTPTKCIDACQGLGKKYAGLQYVSDTLLTWLRQLTAGQRVLVR